MRHILDDKIDVILIVQVQLEIPEIGEYGQYLLVERVQQIIQLVVSEVYPFDMSARSDLLDGVEQTGEVVLLQVDRSQGRIARHLIYTHLVYALQVLVRKIQVLLLLSLNF